MTLQCFDQEHTPKALLLGRELFSDCRFSVGGVQIPAHKAFVLKSPVLRKMVMDTGAWVS